MDRKFAIELELLQGLDEDYYFELYKEIISAVYPLNRKINGMRLIGEINLMDISLPSINEDIDILSA